MTPATIAYACDSIVFSCSRLASRSRLAVSWKVLYYPSRLASVALILDNCNCDIFLKMGWKLDTMICFWIISDSKSMF